MKQLNSYQFEEVYKSLGINLDTLGCIMLDLEPVSIDQWLCQDGVTAYLTGFPFHYTKNKDRFWIDGWVAKKTPQITLLYGLLESGKNFDPHIGKVLKGWKIEAVEIEDIGFFESPYPDEPFYCIVAYIKPTPELIEGHQRLEFLPHINTSTGYKAHFTLAYIEKNEVVRDNFIADLKKEFVGKKLKIDGSLRGGL